VTRLLTFLMIVTVIVLIILAATAIGWAADRRRLKLQAEMKLPVNPELVEQAASRLILDMDSQREQMARWDERWKGREAELVQDLTACREAIGRLEWILSLCSYDPITGHLEREGVVTGARLYAQLGGHQTEAAFRARLLEGVKSGLYRAAEGDEGRVYWLNPARTQVVLAADDDAPDSVLALSVNRLVEAMENGLALPAGRE